MSTSKKTHDLIRQNEQVVKKSQKHDTNLQKNSVLYFQVGLIVCLLAAFSLLEMRFERVIITSDPEIALNDNFPEVSIEEFKVYEESKPKIKQDPLNKKVILDKDPEIVDDDFQIKNVVEIITGDQNTSSEKPVNVSSLTVAPAPVDDDVIFINVEQVPIYPGCEKEKSNDAKRKCMSNKITKLVQKQFDTNLGNELGLSGRQIIHTQFKIDNKGRVTDIQTSRVHPKLKEEAERVINKIPQMTPGKQREKPVGVIYTLPIVFEVQN